MRAHKPSPAGMIDLHSHILPMIDDGAQNLRESLEIAQLAWEDGITQMVATPHDTGWGGSWQSTRESVQTLQVELGHHEIPLQVLPGLEIRIALNTPKQAREGHLLTLNDSRYLLIELPFTHYPPYTDHVIFELQVAGFVPILAHPERYSYLKTDPMKLFALVERGALVQITTSSILGEFGARVRDFSRLLLEHRLAHVISSDAHGVSIRPPGLSQAIETASRWIGEQQATAMVTSIPEAIVNDQTWQTESPVEPKPERRWFRAR